MKPREIEGTARFAISLVIALLPTFALLFFMTVLINPPRGPAPLAPASMSIHYQLHPPAVKDDEMLRLHETVAPRESAPPKPIDDQPQQLATKRDEEASSSEADPQIPGNRETGRKGRRSIGGRSVAASFKKRAKVNQRKVGDLRKGMTNMFRLCRVLRAQR